jgi:hypothetical protein
MRKTAFHKPSMLQALLLDIQRDLFQRFLSLEPSDLRVDPYYPALPKLRTDQMLMIEVLVSSGTDIDRKKRLVAGDHGPAATSDRSTNRQSTKSKGVRPK